MKELDTTSRLVEPFDNRYRKCSGCGLTLHVYQYPYADSSRTERDYSCCLSCRYERALGSMPRNRPSEARRRVGEHGG